MVRSAEDRSPISCEAWVESLAERLNVAREGLDAEGVHGVRTACARLDVFLRLRGWRVLRDDLRWLRRAASAVRDLDVLRARELPDPLRADLELRRGPAQAAFVSAASAERCNALLAALSVVPPLSRSAARSAAHALRDAVAKRGAALEHAPTNAEAAHALRRRLRRWRYANEWLGRDSHAARALQDELGALNDAAVALQCVEALEPSPALDEFQLRLVREAAERISSSLRVWRASRREILQDRA